MTSKTTLKMKNGYLQCSCEGGLDGAALLALAEESLKAEYRQALGGILADMRKSSPDISMFDAIQFGEHLAELASPAIGGKTAIVHDDQGEAAARLFETALINRCFTVRRFRDFDAAEAWLTGRILPHSLNRQ